MDKTIIRLLLLLWMPLACECPKNTTDTLLSAEQKLWFSEAPGNESVVKANSTNGFSEEYRIYAGPTGDRSQELSTPNGECPKYVRWDGFHCDYFSALATYYFNFSYDTQTLPATFKMDARTASKSYSDCIIKFSLDQYQDLSYFFYYPYQEKQTRGLRNVGDSTINQKTYNDIYRFDIEINLTGSLDLKSLILSKKKGLIAFQTLNGTIWYLE